MPTAQWYYSAKIKELYHYTSGVFECHSLISTKERTFSDHHTLKVIAVNTMEVEVETNDKNKFNMIDGQYIKPIKLEWITEKNETETLLLQRKKRHL